MNKTRRIALYIYLVLAGIGLQFELGDMAEKDVTLEAGRDLVLNLAVLAAFFLPFYFLIKKLAKKLSVETIVLGTALFGGAFISGWLSFAGNSLIDIINSNFIKDPAVFNDWTNALTAPFAEEFFKSLTAFAALYILGRKDIQSVLIAGLSSGFGFQVIEDIAYVSRVTFGGQNSGSLEAVGRIAGGLASHTLYTAVVTVGVYLLFSTAYKKYRLFGLWCVVSTVANHFIWNSPSFETEHRINIVVGFLFAFLVATFIEVYRLVLKEKKTDLEI